MTTRNIDNDPIGVGFKSPLTFTNGHTALSAATSIAVTGDGGIGEVALPMIQRLVATEIEQKAVIQHAMRRIIGQRRGAGFFDGSAGSLVDEVVMEPNDPISHDLAISYAVFAIVEQLPRVVVLEANAGTTEEGTQILGFISYKILRSDVTDNVIVFQESI